MNSVTSKPKPAFEFDIYIGEDGVPVVHIDTPAEWDNDNGPSCRIYLNDGEAIWNNPPLPKRNDKP